jgi:hypothetical protein
MHVAVFSIFAVSKKEPLAIMLERVHAAFVATGFGEPSVSFGLTDHVASTTSAIVAQVAGLKRVSSVGRVLKRFPELAKFARSAPVAADGSATITGLSNLTPDGFIEPAGFATLLEIARVSRNPSRFRRPGFSSRRRGFPTGRRCPPRSVGRR